jgi:hypothetical protein
VKAPARCPGGEGCETQNWARPGPVRLPVLSSALRPPAAAAKSMAASTSASPPSPGRSPPSPGRRSLPGERSRVSDQLHRTRSTTNPPSANPTTPDSSERYQRLCLRMHAPTLRDGATAREKQEGRQEGEGDNETQPTTPPNGSKNG